MEKVSDVGLLKHDDYSLTIRELKSQRVQCLIQLELLDAGIGYAEVRLKALGPRPVVASGPDELEV